MEILDWLDDHARYALSVTAHRRVTSPIVLETFREAIDTHGIPASTLTDNRMVFTTRLSGGKGGRNGFESELRRLGVTQINSTPNHPTTCGKVERFHQTLKKWLTNQPPASAIPELQNQLDTFVEAYNHHRPHRSMPHQATPATARPKAGPATRLDTHDRVRTDCIDQAGVITLRVAGRLHHIGIGRTYTGTRVLILVQDLHIRIINAATGALLRELPSTRQGTTNPPEHPKARNGRSSEPNAGSDYSDVLRHHTSSGGTIRTCGLLLGDRSDPFAAVYCCPLEYDRWTRIVALANGIQLHRSTVVHRRLQGFGW